MVAKIFDAMQAYRLVMIRLGGLLSAAKDAEIWHDEIGDGIDTWYDFISQPEVGLTPAEASFLMHLYELAQDEGEGDVSRIPTATVRYMFRKGGNIDDAQVLTTKDFKDKYFEDGLGKMIKRTYTYMVMKRCNETGNITKVHGIDTQDVKSALSDLIADDE